MSSLPAAGHRWSLVVAYSTIDLVACVGMLVILVTCAFTERLRRNPVLLNFHLMFFVTAAGGTLLTWTGHAMDLSPPRGLCVTSAAFVSSVATGKATVAFALTCQVWAHIMMLNRPQSRPLQLLASPKLLLPLPWVIFIAIFLSAAGLGASQPSAVARSSVYYCQFNNRLLANVNYGTAAVFEVVTIAFAAWVAHSVLRVRRRALGLASTQSQPVHRALALRTVVFGAVLFVALVLELVCLLVNVTLPIPGMILATIDLIAVVVFASDPILLRALARRVRGEEDTISRSGYQGGPSSRVAVSVHVATSGPVGDDERIWKGALPLRTLPKHDLHHDASVDEGDAVDSKLAWPMPHEKGQADSL